MSNTSGCRVSTVWSLPHIKKENVVKKRTSVGEKEIDIIVKIIQNQLYLIHMHMYIYTYAYTLMNIIMYMDV